VRVQGVLDAVGCAPTNIDLDLNVNLNATVIIDINF
jgi:hypothetical protein